MDKEKDKRQAAVKTDSSSESYSPRKMIPELVDDNYYSMADESLVYPERELW